MSSIVVVDYDPQWPRLFESLREKVWSVVGDFAIAVEHVGSTSVPGLAAKPVIDLSIVVANDDDAGMAIRQLAVLGYKHRGNLGIEGREAFSNPPGLVPHHLYVCPKGSLGLRNHLQFRDYLRYHADAAKSYGTLKKQLAKSFPGNIDAYVDGKTNFIIGALSKAGMSSDERDSVEAANRMD